MKNLIEDKQFLTMDNLVIKCILYYMEKQEFMFQKIDNRQIKKKVYKMNIIQQKMKFFYIIKIIQNIGMKKFHYLKK